MPHTTSSHRAPVKSPRALLGSALLLGCLAWSVPVLAEPATDHARFYPSATQFYMELNTPSDFSHRGLEWAAQQIDTMTPSQTSEETITPKPRWIKKKVKGRWVNVAVKGKPTKVTHVVKPTKTATEVLREVETLVDPVMSIGLWDLKTDADHKKLHASFAIIFNTKPTLTAEYIQSKADKKSKEPVTIDTIGTLFEAVDKSSPTMLLTNDNHLILTDKVSDIQQVVDVIKDNNTALQNDNTYKEASALLGKNAPEGAFFWNVKDFSFEKFGLTPITMGLAPMPSPSNDESVEKKEGEKEGTKEGEEAPKPTISEKDAMVRTMMTNYMDSYGQLLKAFPYGTASIRFAPTVDSQDQIVIDLLCPYAPKSVTNPRLKTALDNYMTHQGPTQLGQWLPDNTMLVVEAKNAADYVWLLTEMASTPEIRDKWKESFPPILKASKFSVKKHMLGFIDGEFGVALTPRSFIPGVVTMFNLNKDTKEFLDWGVELATHGDKGVVISEGIPLSQQDWMKVITTQKMPFELAYGSLNQTTLVTGMKPAIDDMRTLIDTQAGGSSSTESSTSMPLTPLTQSPVFQSPTQTMPAKTQYWSYINLNEFAKWTDTNFGSIINSKVKTTALKKAYNSGKKLPVLESKEPFSLVKFLQPVQGLASWGSMATPTLYKGRIVFLMTPGLVTPKL